MRIVATQYLLEQRPFPVESCFFCGMPMNVQDIAALWEADSGRRLGLSCPTCLLDQPDHLRAQLNRKAVALHDSARHWARHAQQLEAQAVMLEQIMDDLSEPLMQARIMERER